MPIYDAEDIVELKNRKKRRKRLIKFLIFLLLAALAGSLYYFRDEWLPKLRGLGKQYRTIVNDGELAEGNFPINVNSGADYQLQCSGNQLFLLSDAYIYYYNVNGGQLKKRQHPYNNPVINSADETVIVYESGGNEFSVEDESSVIYSKQLDESIIFARVNEDNYAAVVTTSENYACCLRVYNNNGEVIYERNCVERLCDISFTGNTGCILSYIGADKGALVTTVQKIIFNEKKELWTSPAVDTFGLEVAASDDGAFVTGFDACAYIDSAGQIISFYPYEGDFAGGDSSGGISAVIINDSDRKSYTLAMFSNNSGTPVTAEFNEPLRHVEIYDGLVYVMSGREIYTYEPGGMLRSTAAVSESYEEFRRSEDYIFLMGYNKIDRIDYAS